jgi:hypothetical protein
MSEEQRVTRVINEYKEPVEVSLVRGAKGTYRWTINVKADSPGSALRSIQDIDSELRHRYPSETSAVDKPTLGG